MTPERWRELLVRRPAASVFLAVLGVLLALHARSLHDPPYWDALIGAFPQGLWLAQHDFGLVRLLTQERTCPDGGPNVYPFSVYPLFVGGLYAAGLEPRHVFLVVHLVVLACAAAAASAFFALARAAVGTRTALWATLVFTSAPMFHALASQMNMDMPLCACTLLSARELQRERFGRAWCWALAALLVLPRGVIVVAANLLALAVLLLRRVDRAGGPGTAEACRVEAPTAQRTGASALDARGDPSEAAARTHGPGGAASNERSARRAAGRACAAHAGLLVLFVLEVLLSSRFSSGPAYLSPFGGFADLARRVLWLVPDFGAAFVVAACGALVVAARAWRGRARWTELVLAAFVLVFLGFFGQYTNTLPRYLLQAHGHVLLLLVLLAVRGAWSARIVHAVLALAVVFQAVNHTGALYPAVRSGWIVPGYAERGLDSNDGHVLERSMAYRDDLLLDQEVARRLERYDRARTRVVAPWPLTHALAFPELGYVERAWRTSSPSVPITYDPRAAPLGDVYDLRARPVRLRTDLDVVWVLVPSVYLPPMLALQPAIDVVDEVVERGRHRAFLVRRVGWSPR